jgi:hypothetical protein
MVPPAALGTPIPRPTLTAGTLAYGHAHPGDKTDGQNNRRMLGLVDGSVAIPRTS